jgi:hypothetical protein
VISTADQLENRGFLGNPEYKEIIKRNIQSVDSLFNSKKAVERTAAIRFIRDKKDFSFIKKLTEQLKWRISYIQKLSYVNVCQILEFNQYHI